MRNQQSFTLGLLLISFTQITLVVVEASNGEKKKPNILLLLPDQWRYDWDGRDDEKPLKIPQFRRLAAQGTRFLHVYTPLPLCAPSRACLASGRDYDDARVPNNFCKDYDIELPTFYSFLRDKGGYQTLTVGKDDLTKATHLGTTLGKDGMKGLYHQSELGFSKGGRCAGKGDAVFHAQPHEMYGHWLQQQTAKKKKSNQTITGWDAYYTCLKKPNMPCTNDMVRDEWYEDTYIAHRALDVLAETTNNQPWFLQVNFAGPHPPFLVTQKQRQQVENKTFPAPIIDNNPNNPPITCVPIDQPNNNDRDRCDYAAELEQLDALVGLLLEKIVNNNTIVCFTSDHGEMLGDHGLKGKTFFWQGSVGVPLVCAGPGIRQGLVVEKPFVSTVDLAAAFLDFAGVPLEDGMTSQSLRSLLEQGQDPLYRSIIQSGLQSLPFQGSAPRSEKDYSWRMVVDSQTGLKYICCLGKRHCGQSRGMAPPTEGAHEFLFNTTTDPFDMEPLDLPNELKRLRSLLPKGFPCLPNMEEGYISSVSF